jgi:hypothetical protein
MFIEQNQIQYNDFLGQNGERCLDVLLRYAYILHCGWYELMMSCLGT